MIDSEIERQMCEQDDQRPDRYAVEPFVARHLPGAPKLLFLLKHRDCGEYSYSHASGLGNSTKFIVDMLDDAAIEAKLVEVVDANDIDREVAQYKPTHVIIEALWVVPQKLKEVSRLHQAVKWIIHLHSELPFLASEGIAIEWLIAYMAVDRVCIASNSTTATHDIRSLLHASLIGLSAHAIRSRVHYLPNFYPIQPVEKKECLGVFGEELNIACFSAVRPFKNQLIQAAAALQFARERNKRLCFHINGTRVEQAGESVLRNLRAMFASTNSVLVEHPWLEHDRFLVLLRSMDIGMQVSMTETFNVVAADMVIVGLPIVVSHEIGWVSSASQVEAGSLPAIVSGLHDVSSRAAKIIATYNAEKLHSFCRVSRLLWQQHFSAMVCRS